MSWKQNENSSPYGTCALCLKEKALCRSHLLPKSLYRLIRSEGAPNPNPFAVVQTATQAKAALTSRQTAKHLLCSVCENLLSSGGEKYVLAHCLRQDRTFPLRDKVLQGEPLVRAGGELLYHSSRNPGIKRSALLHFAAGVFWKASVSLWHAPVGGVALRNSLGPTYEEAFRRYLIGESPFPESARLMIWLCGEENPPIIVLFPDLRRAYGHHAHRFFVPGLCFHMLVGGILPPDVPPIWGSSASEVPILVHSVRQEGVHQDAFDALGKRARDVIRKIRRRVE